MIDDIDTEMGLDTDLNDEVEIVECDSCGRAFEGYGWGNDQATGCASTVDDNHIIGHYGSTTIDGELHKFVERPEWVSNGTICDGCVTKLQDGGNIKLAENGRFFG